MPIRIRIKRNGARKSRWVEQFLLLVGILALNVFVWSMVRTAFVERQESRDFDGLLRQRSGDSRPSPFPGRRAESEPGIPPGGVIGRLSIPRLGLTTMVREGDGANILSVAAGHIPGTALPGQTGNIGVAAHRDTLFRPLAKIRRNDAILFQTLSGSYRYKVESIQIVKPQDTAVLNANQSPELTLVTCYPFYYIGAAPDRFIVKARLDGHPHTGSVVAAQNY